MIAVEYLVSSVAMMLTIIGIPFGLQTIKLSLLALLPFGTSVEPTSPSSGGCLNSILNFIWWFVGGIPIALTHLLWGGSILYYYCRCAIWNATLQINASCNVPVWENIGLILKLSELYCILSE